MKRLIENRNPEYKRFKIKSYKDYYDLKKGIVSGNYPSINVVEKDGVIDFTSDKMREYYHNFVKNMINNTIIDYTEEARDYSEKFPDESIDIERLPHYSKLKNINIPKLEEFTVTELIDILEQISEYSIQLKEEMFDEYVEEGWEFEFELS